MDTALREFLRTSPYQLANILKFYPSALLSESDMKSSVEIHSHKTKLISTGSNLHPIHEETAAILDQACYFCKEKSTVHAWGRCGECRKIVCPSCMFRCGKCDKPLCQLDRTYDYGQ